MSKSDPPPYSAPGPGFIEPQNMYPPPPQPQQTVIVTTHTVPLSLGDQPTATICPYCHAQIVTSVETEPNTRTHLIALLLCLCVCWPCVCLPYCMDSCQSKKHSCPNCKAYLGTFSG